jgi:type II secretion system protein N
MSKRALTIIGYIGFGVVSLLMGLYLTFPADAVGQRLAHEVAKASQGRLTLSFDDVSLYRLSGIEAEGVKVRAMQEGSAPLEFQLDALRARLRLLPLLWLSVSVDAEIESGNGTLSARITPKSGGGLDTAVDLDEFSLTSPPILPTLAGIPLAGKISGDVHGSFSEKDSKQTAGGVSLKLAGLSFGPGTLHLPIPGMTEKMDFSLPSAVEFGNLSLETPVEQGRMTVKSFTQQGGDMQLKVSGTLSLRPQLGTSALDMCIQVKPDPAFLAKNPKIKDALTFAEVQIKKDGQGFLNIPLAGTLSRPRLKGGLCRAGGSPAPAPPGLSPKGKGLGPAPDKDKDEE